MNEDEFLSTLQSHYTKLPSLQTSLAFFYDQTMGFYHAVAWKEEKWLMALFVFHCSHLALVIFGRKLFKLQFCLFITSCGLIFLSERINTIARENWREFATQNYFDKHGVFMGVVFSAPLLAILTIQLLVTLSEASELVVKVKRHEFGLEAKEKIT
jgi:hypothetical protein